MTDYKPDRTFISNLHRLDKRLGVKFNGQHFVITYDRGYGEPINILVIKSENGGFRQPDRRDLNKLNQGDMSKQRFRDYWDRISKHFYDFREGKRAKTKEFFRDLTKDNKIQLGQAFGRLSSKSNAAFRRIDPKSKGKVF